MNALQTISETDRYARCVQTSKRVRWDIDKDVIRGRRFDTAEKFLPDGLSMADAFTSLSQQEADECYTEYQQVITHWKSSHWMASREPQRLEKNHSGRSRSRLTVQLSTWSWSA